MKTNSKAIASLVTKLSAPLCVSREDQDVLEQAYGMTAELIIKTLVSDARSELTCRARSAIGSRYQGQNGQDASQFPRSA